MTDVVTWSPGADHLTEAETRAGLRAVRRVVELARDAARRRAGPEAVADLLATAGTLPELIGRPDLFRDRFRPALELLAERHAELAPALTEFDRWTDPAARGARRRSAGAHDHYWIDVGAGD